jgi:ParB-like chromosome segregation protein Spo0J
MKTELWPIDQVIPYPGNPRKIPKSAITKVATSIEQYGWRQPIVVDRNRVTIVGHVRWLAAKELHRSEVPVHVAEDLTATQVRAYRLMDNRSHEETSGSSQ